MSAATVRKPIVLSNNYHLFPFSVWHADGDVGGPKVSEGCIISGPRGWPSAATTAALPRRELCAAKISWINPYVAAILHQQSTETTVEAVYSK